MTETKRCMTPDCCGEHYSRGICRRCYERLNKRVMRGRTTWVDLINEGLCKRVKSRLRRDNKVIIKEHIVYISLNPDYFIGENI